jgi:cytochrome P450
LRGTTPSIADLAELPLARAIFEESMRLYPPAWGQPRETIAEDEIQGYAIPKKAVVTVNQYLTHRHPDFWEAPDEFRPDRFLGTHPERPKFAYFPFGGGPRICIGNNFAMMEGPLVLAALAQRFRFELLPGQQVQLDPTFTLRPKHAVHMKVSAR